VVKKMFQTWPRQLLCVFFC